MFYVLFFELEENKPGINKVAEATGKPLHQVPCLNEDFHTMLPDQLATANTVLVRYDYDDHFNYVRPGDYLLIDKSCGRPEPGKIYLFNHSGRYILLTYEVIPGSPTAFSLSTDSQSERGLVDKLTREEAENLIDEMELIGRPLWTITKRLTNI